MYYRIAVKAESGLQKAEEELFCYLKAIGNVSEVNSGTDGDFLIRVVCKKMQEGDFSLKSDGKVLDIAGNGLNEVLCGVYTALEEYGVKFGISGEVIPESVDFSVSFERHVTPAVLYRGIRQHLNFPMDISSYSLNEAKRYIRNLARLRYNSITFHSYPGQFYCGKYQGEKISAGKFFYGEVQPVSNIAFLKNNVSNLNYFCIEESEQYFNDEEKLSEYAIFWLRSVMQECKSYGMRVVFSFEVRGADAAEIDGMIAWVRKSYPQADIVELATQECGCGWDDSACIPSGELRELATQLYGKPIVEKIGPLLNGRYTQMPLTLREMKKCIEAAKRNERCRVLIYATCIQTLHVCRRILQEYGVEHAFLCAHGAKYVEKNLDELLAEGDSIPGVYSWIEFDGNMFQPENKDGHNFDLLHMLRKKSRGSRIPEISLNHWRNAENSLSIAYCAELMIDCTPPAFFYEKADLLCGLSRGGIEKLCETIAKAEDCARDELPNIGFCAVYCWYNADREYLGYISLYDPQKLEKYEKLLDEARAVADSLQPTGAVGERLRAFWSNRLRAGVCHVQTIRALMPLNELAKCKDQDSKEKMAQVCSCALEYAKKYLRITSEYTADRGGQGVLISYYKTIFQYIYVLRERLCGIPVPETYEKRNLDTPPSPMIQKNVQ